MKIKIKDIRDTKPCKRGWDRFSSTLKKYQKVTTIEDILESNGISDTFWVINFVLKDRQAFADLARQFADSVKHLGNYYSIKAAVADGTSLTFDSTSFLNVVNVGAVDGADAAIYAAYADYYAADAADAAIYAAYADYAAADAERERQKQMIINYFK